MIIRTIPMISDEFKFFVVELDRTDRKQDQPGGHQPGAEGRTDQALGQHIPGQSLRPARPPTRPPTADCAADGA